MSSITNKVLCYRQPTQTITRVVKITRSKDQLSMLWNTTSYTPNTNMIKLFQDKIPSSKRTNSVFISWFGFLQYIQNVNSQQCLVWYLHFLIHSHFFFQYKLKLILENDLEKKILAIEKFILTICKTTFVSQRKPYFPMNQTFS